MPIYSQGYQVGAKLGTVFYGEAHPADWAGLAADLSQDETDLLEGTNCIYAVDDARFNRSGPRTVHLELTIGTTSDGTVYLQGASGLEQSLYIVSGVVNVVVNGADIGALTPAGLGATSRMHQLAWVTEPNPDATGSSDAELSWLVSWNNFTSTATRVGPIAHEVANASAALVVFGAFADDGTDAYSDEISIASFHHRAMTLTEVYNDFVTAAAAISTEVEVGREVLPLTLASGVGDQDQCYGPTHAWAAATARGLSQRLATARHERFPALELSNAYADSTSPEWVWSVPQTVYRGHLAHVLALPVPPTCDRMWVRLHAKLWVTSGAAVPIGIRVYCSNRPPELADEFGAPQYSATYVGALVSRDDGVGGTGQWWTPQLLEITRGAADDPLRDDWVYVSIVWAIDPAAGSANDAAARLQINAIHLVPCLESV